MKTGSVEKTEALKLCKARKKLIKEAIESRYSFAAAHVSYTTSLKNIGIVLSKYAETVEPVVGNNETTCDDRSSCHSPNMLVGESPVSGRCSYMKCSGSKAVTLYAEKCENVYASNVENGGNGENFENGGVKVSLLRNYADNGRNGENGGVKGCLVRNYAENVKNGGEGENVENGRVKFSPFRNVYAENGENVGYVEIFENGDVKSSPFGNVYAENGDVLFVENDKTTDDRSSCHLPSILPVECLVSGRCSGSKAVTLYAENGKFNRFRNAVNSENVENYQNGGVKSTFRNGYAENGANGENVENFQNGDVKVGPFRNLYAENGENIGYNENGDVSFVMSLETPLSGLCSYMESNGTKPVTVKFSPFRNVYAENGNISPFRNVCAENGENVEIFQTGGVKHSPFKNGCAENGEHGGVKNSPSRSQLPLESPLSGRCSYMKASGTKSVTVKISPFRNVYAENGENAGNGKNVGVNNSPFGNAYGGNGENGDVSFVMPPPPPPLPEPGSTWDYFDPGEDCKSFRFVGLSKSRPSSEDFGVYNELDDDKFVTPESSSKGNGSKSLMNNGIISEDGDGLNKALMVKSASEPSSSKKDKGVVKGEMGEEREDPSEFITHRAKDFLSSIKDIEHRFFRASESGREVYRMLEANKIRVGYSEAKVGSSVSDFLAALRLVCCRTKMSLVSNEPSESRTKVITWKRTTSSRSSSSRNHLTSASKDDNDDSGSDFAEEFCMISGSHSSTLERLYAWERKLYDEVKASETIRKEYDRKCDQLRHQFAKDMSTHVIDKTRAVVKDLHSRIRVALHAVNAISKRIEKMRDDELQPQLVELIQGLIRMWKSMLECHHAQYITISLAYHAKPSRTYASQETRIQIMTELEEEIELFGLSFANWINSHTTYVEALNGWLQNCIMLPRERTSRRRAFSPRRVLAPPIFVLSRDWSAGIKALPSEELSNAIKGFLSELRHSIRQQAEEQKTVISNKTDESDGKVEENNENRSSDVCSIHLSLAKVLDRLTKFSEASLKMCEDIRQKCETARNAYCNYRPHRF